MMHTSLFDLFKIGIGPSSSHSVGPMRAAYRFLLRISQTGMLGEVARLRVELYGSLALTGIGSCTHHGILLGLMGEEPHLVNTAHIDERIRSVREQAQIQLLGRQPIRFESDDLVFRKDQIPLRHSNAMRFTALDARGCTVETRIYYSVGEGFVSEEGEDFCAQQRAYVPYPFASAGQLLRIGEEHHLTIHLIMLSNEMAWQSLPDISNGIHRIWQVMQECTKRGLDAEGEFPGGLHVKRRARDLARKLQKASDPLTGMDWLKAWAMAVSEENAAGGPVVAAPTNGAAGIMPAVAHYYMRFMQGTNEGIQRYFLTAAAIGVVYEENASMSSTEVGCQGEVGVACSMAAAGLVSAIEGTNQQIERAAQIAMENNLGMTCDPVGRLVEIPCVERNVIGAAKAVNAARMAVLVEEYKGSLDQVIRTMYQTGLDMQTR